MARLGAPSTVGADASGAIFSDGWTCLVRRVRSNDSVVVPYAGLSCGSFVGEGGPATAARIGVVNGAVSDLAGGFILVRVHCALGRPHTSHTAPSRGLQADNGLSAVRRVFSTGTLVTITGTTTRRLSVCDRS